MLQVSIIIVINTFLENMLKTDQNMAPGTTHLFVYLFILGFCPEYMSK